MGTRSTPTQRQKRLGAELRKSRLAAGVATEYAAGLLGIDRTRLSNMESGIRPFSSERVRTLASNYACADTGYVDALAAMAESKEQGWWEQYRGTLPAGLLDVAELEWHAARVRTVQFMHAPGLLQTEEYARGIFTAVLPAVSRLEVELRVAHRMARQQVLERPNPLPYLAYVHEAALRMRFGSDKATRDQLKHLAERSEQDGVDVRVIPVTVSGFPGAGHAMLYANGPVASLDTVQLDSAHGPTFTDAEAQLTKYRAHLDWMDDVSLSPAASRDFMLTIAREL
ncbi:helix-turn-helix transcriptional regulator [Streptomyces sp. NBC_01275]|uniref:helix-turn-helix domain-containing protein n=1 Tax=Streptomyces sp. NBC_01275 TaxID=2903807 RepID=UPI00224DDF02|nr:helix-turn-helix transcriptional regulator [Streptomyces sp. NBC_01275]MCX4762955.1 helix-turn-helix transcriptional regulator [Streptomyces sp. NBC_01275]